MSRFTVGMKVVLVQYDHLKKSEYLGTGRIGSVTASGQVVTLMNGQQFSGDSGRERPRPSHYRYTYIEPFSEKYHATLTAEQLQRVDLLQMA